MTLTGSSETTEPEPRRAPRVLREPNGGLHHLTVMKGKVVFLLIALVPACASPGNTTSEPTILTAVEPDRLLAELAAAGLEVKQAEGFSSDPLGGEGLLLCVGPEEVRMYRFESEEAAQAAASRIDPADPSNVGNALLNGSGSPAFGSEARCLCSIWAPTRQRRKCSPNFWALRSPRGPAAGEV